MGTAPLAREVLKALLDSERFEIVGVVSQPDRPAGRKMKLQPTPVKELAVSAGLPVIQPEKVTASESLDQLTSWQPDLAVVAAYGQILPKKVLDLPKFGCLNVHASILPEYRGAAPVQWAVYDRKPESGVTIMKMDAGMDTGDIVSIRKTPIDPDESSEQLMDRLAVLGGQLLLDTIDDYVSGTVTPIPQDNSLATHARKIEKSDSQIDWSRTPEDIKAQVLAFSPWPGSSSSILAGKSDSTSEKASNNSSVFKVWKVIPHPMDPDWMTVPAGQVVQADKKHVIVRCGSDGALALEEIQFPGSRRLPIEAIQSASAFQTGQQLGS